MTNVKDVAYQFEAVQVSMNKDKNGFNLRLCIHPDDVPDGLLRDWVGSRYGVAMVRINEHEEVDIKPTELEGQRLVKSAIMSCKEPEFWEALMNTIKYYNNLRTSNYQKEYNIDSEEVCVKALKAYLKINSRKELATNELAQVQFKNLRKIAWEIKNDQHKNR
tara:strand:+ start:464 stop:952 length:489 start_codon:yes stop_codon:yes gene_type:complete